MAYSTLNDLKLLISEATLLQLCDDDNVGDIVVDPSNTAYGNIVYAISQADNTIDSYICGKYTLPLDSTPKSIADASAQLAVCNLYARRREMDVPDGMKVRRDGVMKWLKDVQAGDARIPEIETTGVQRTYRVNKTADDRVFTDDVLNQY